MARSAPSSLFPQGAPELPVVAGDVQTLQGAQELVVAQPQVLEARGWVAAQTLHAAYLVAVQLQDLRPADRQPGSPGRTESAPSFSTGHPPASANCTGLGVHICTLVHAQTHTSNLSSLSVARSYSSSCCSVLALPTAPAAPAPACEGLPGSFQARGGLETCTQPRTFCPDSSLEKPGSRPINQHKSLRE